MCKKIVKEISGISEEFKLSDRYVAYHENVDTMYDVYESVECHLNGGFLSNLKIILDEDNNDIVAKLYAGISDGYKLISLNELNSYQKICNAYKRKGQ